MAVALRGPNNRLGLVARVDLTDAPNAARALAGHMNNDGAHRVIVVTYTPDQTAARRATDALIGELTGGQWFQGWQVTATGYRALYEDEPLRPLEDITTNAEAVRMIVGGIALANSAADLLPQPAGDDEQNDAVSAVDRWTSGPAKTTPRPKPSPSGRPQPPQAQRSPPRSTANSAPPWNARRCATPSWSP